MGAYFYFINYFNYFSDFWSESEFVGVVCPLPCIHSNGHIPMTQPMMTPAQRPWNGGDGNMREWEHEGMPIYIPKRRE